MTRTRSDAAREQKLRDHQESSDRDKRVEARQRNVDSQKARDRDEWKQQQDERKRLEQEDFDLAGREMVCPASIRSYIAFTAQFIIVCV